MTEYGLGGSAEAAISALAGAAAAAEEDGVFYAKDLAHLYRGIMMHKAGRDRAVVDAELHLATKGKCPNFASCRAHQILGTKDERPVERPKAIYEEKKEAPKVKKELRVKPRWLNTGFLV